MADKQREGQRGIEREETGGGKRKIIEREVERRAVTVCVTVKQGKCCIRPNIIPMRLKIFRTMANPLSFSVFLSHTNVNTHLITDTLSSVKFSLNSVYFANTHFTLKWL